MSLTRVCQVLEAYGGGTRRHLLQLAGGLDKHRFEVTAVLSFERVPAHRADAALLHDSGVRVVELPMSPRISPLADLQAYRWLRAFFAEERFDVIHLHSSRAGFLGRLAARPGGAANVLYSPHAFAFQDPHKPLSNRIFLFCERLAAPWCRKIVAVSHGEKRLAVERGLRAAGDIAVIENGVDADAVERASAAPISRDALRLPPGPIVGMVGRLMPQKGVEFLLRLAPAVVKELPDIRFVIVGEGPLRPRLERLRDALGLASNVFLPGEHPEPERVYPMFDLFALASLWEGCPYSLLEAMASGVPSVVTRVAGSEDAVTEETGRVVPVGQWDEFAAQIVRLLRDEPLRRAMGMAAKARVRERYSAARCITTHEALYAELA